jgi:hypothetical protein
MWAYRLRESRQSFLQLGLTLPFERVVAAIRYNPIGNVAPGGTVTEMLDGLRNDCNESCRLFSSMGWDKTGALTCFGVPGDQHMTVGFIIQEVTTGRTFIGSPVELPHLNDACDYNGRCDSAEVERTRAVMEGRVFQPPTSLDIKPWMRSVRGNAWTSINGTNVTVFKATDMRANTTGYKAVIVGAIGNQKIYTPAFRTEQDAVDYVVKHFLTMTAPWRMQGIESVSDDDDE